MDLEVRKSSADVTPEDKRKLKGLLEHYGKQSHPFTACVRDNRKRFGPGTEAVCATLKDVIRGTTYWRGESKKSMDGDDFCDYLSDDQLEDLMHLAGADPFRPATEEDMMLDGDFVDDDEYLQEAAGAVPVTKGWDPVDHPRYPKGTELGGQFAPKPGSDVFLVGGFNDTKVVGEGRVLGYGYATYQHGAPRLEAHVALEPDPDRGRPEHKEIHVPIEAVRASHPATPKYGPEDPRDESEDYNRTVEGFKSDLVHAIRARDASWARIENIDRIGRTLTQGEAVSQAIRARGQEREIWQREDEKIKRAANELGSVVAGRLGEAAGKDAVAQAWVEAKGGTKISDPEGGMPGGRKVRERANVRVPESKKPREAPGSDVEFSEAPAGGRWRDQIDPLDLLADPEGGMPEPYSKEMMSSDGSLGGEGQAPKKVDQGKRRRKRKRKDEGEAYYSVAKSSDEMRYTLGVLYAPDRIDAHEEFVEDNVLHKALIGYMRQPDRKLWKQHDRKTPIGEVVEAVRWPFEVEVPVTTPGVEKASRTVTMPAGTVFMGVVWEEDVWPDVKAGKVKGLSLGGKAVKVRGLEKDAPAMRGYDPSETAKKAASIAVERVKKRR